MQAGAGVEVDSPGGSEAPSAGVDWWYRLRSIDIIQVCAAVVFISLLALSSSHHGPLLALSVYLIIAAGISVYLYCQGREFKEIVFHTHIREGSWIQIFRRRQAGLFLVSLVAGLVLALSLSVFLLTVHWLTLASVVLVPLLFPGIRRFYWRKTGNHLKHRSRICVTNLLTTVTLGLVMMVAMIAAKWIQLHYFVGDFVLGASDHMANYVISQVNHGLIWFQHLGRTLAMFELELLRAQQMAYGWWGHALLIYFLLPSGVAALTLPIFYSGLYFLFKGSHIPEENEGAARLSAEKHSG